MKIKVNLMFIITYLSKSK